uniref:lysosomal cobalamin transport escort protein LMBD1 n=1 Tax=Myxine glutinosa TaxID=7769 RepID=UPI00358F323B
MTEDVIFIFAVSIPILAFVPLKNEQKSNATDWEKLAVLVDELGSAYGLDALAFSVSTLTLLGMLCLITYMAYGMSALPTELIKGTKSLRYKQVETSRVAEETEQEILIIKAKCQDGRPLAIRDRCTLERLEERLCLLHRHQACQAEASHWACWEKCRCLMRPFQILLGIFLLLISLLILVTLFMSSLDRALHSAGFQTGFVLHNSTWPSPINLVLIHLQQVFPLDYVFIAVITIYFIFTSMSGLRTMGIWFFWMKLYKVQPRRTRPQALLLVCLILMLIVLYMSYALHILAPQYTMFGSQMYLKMDGHNHSDANVPQQSIHLVPCTIEASTDYCTVTRLYLFLHKFWFFTSIYYLGNWLFILAFIVGMTVSCLKGRSSPIEKALEDYDSDEEPLHM